MAAVAELKERASASEDIGSVDGLLRSHGKDNPGQPFCSSAMENQSRRCFVQLVSTSQNGAYLAN